LKRLAKWQALALQAVLRQQRAIQSPNRINNQDNYRFEFKTVADRNNALKILEWNGLDYDLVEDLRSYVVRLPGSLCMRRS
jgi:hypothetical protein